MKNHEDAILVTQHTQSLTDFRDKADETIDRLNRTGEAEVITIDGEARAVLLSPATYDELTREAQATRDAETIRRAIKEIDEGKGQEAGAFFNGLRAKLLGMKGVQPPGGGE